MSEESEKKRPPQIDLGGLMHLIFWCAALFAVFKAFGIAGLCIALIPAAAIAAIIRSTWE